MSKARRSKEYAAFEKLTDDLLSVSKDELNVRMREHREQAALNPRKRGPKPKAVTPPSETSETVPDAG